MTEQFKAGYADGQAERAPAADDGDYRAGWIKARAECFGEPPATAAWQFDRMKRK